MSPVADQILAAVEEVERVCGVNAHLTEDFYLGALVEFALDGRLTSEEEIDEETGIAVRVIPCNRDYAALALTEADRNIKGVCDRCQNGSAASRVWIPAGASIVSVECCMTCRMHLDSQFSPVVWRD